MNKRVRIYQPGPATATVYEDAPALPEPAAGEVRLRHEAIGINFVDTMFRSGAYAEERNIEARLLIKLPQTISSETAAATFTKGLTAWMMLYGAHKLTAGQTVLVHGAAGGVGSIVARWAKALGANVIATVGSPAKAAVVKAYGIDHVLDANDPHLGQRVRNLTTGRGVDVVYELIGKATFAHSLSALRDGGALIHVGNASGAPDGRRERSNCLEYGGL